MKAKPIGGIDLKRDLQEISKFIEEYVDATYLSQIHNQINTYKRQCEGAPSKETQLLKAVMPFVEGENQKIFSNLIQMMTYSQMIQNMLDNYSESPLLTRGKEEGQTNQGQDYMHQAAVALFLYKAILWSEQYKSRE